MPTTHQPIITVVTVCRNAAATIEQTILSVIAQKIEGLEYIIIDGASTDGTLDIVRKHAEHIDHIISEPDKSLYDAMNKGLRLARGRYLHFLNADDRYFAPDVLQKLLPELEENTVCFAQMVYVSEDGSERRLGAPFSWENELRVSHVPQPTLFVSKKLYEQVGEFELRYRIASDYDMVLRLAQRFPVKYIAQPTTIMNYGGLSDVQMGLAFRESMDISKRYGRSAISSFLTYLSRMLKWQVARRLPPSWMTTYRRVCGRV